MRTRVIGLLALACLVSTILWLVFLVSGLATAAPLKTFEQVLAHVGRLGVSFFATYANAALVTITAMMLYAALYVFCKPLSPVWAAIAIVFVPVYGAMNLFVYLSQITVVPRLIHLAAAPDSQVLANFLLRQAIQQWPDSAVSIANNLAYAVLGIPSIIFGVLLFRAATALRVAGTLLALNGVACMVGFVGIAAGSRLIGNGSLIGGVLFLMALIPLSWVFLTKRELSAQDA